MHRDKTVARILLILSVVHVAAAAPAIVRQRSLDVHEDVTAASEKRGNSGNTQGGLYPVPQLDNDRPSASGTAQLDNDPPPASGAPHDPPPASGTPHDPPPALGTPQLDNDPPPASGATHDPPPASGTPQLDNNRPSALGTSQLDNDPQSASGASHLHDDPLTGSGTPLVHDDPLGPDAFDEEYRPNEVHYVLSSPSHESDTQSLSHESETPPANDHVFSYAPSWHESEAPSTDHSIIDTKKDNLKSLALAGVMGVAFWGSAYGLYVVSNMRSHSKPNGRDLTGSSDVVGRGVSTHPRPSRKQVSRVLANLRNEDLRLSALTRRALERLD